MIFFRLYPIHTFSLSFRNGALRPQRVTRFGVVLVIHQFGIISQIAFMSMEVIFLLLGNLKKKRIYLFLFFSGYVSTASTAAVITNSIYSLDPIGFHWKRQTSSSSYRYLHSAVASSGLMIVFGGNTHNDTSVSHGAKCYSADVLAYDMVCDKWYVLLLPL